MPKGSSLPGSHLGSSLPSFSLMVRVEELGWMPLTVTWNLMTRYSSFTVRGLPLASETVPVMVVIPGFLASTRKVRPVSLPLASLRRWGSATDGSADSQEMRSSSWVRMTLLLASRAVMFTRMLAALPSWLISRPLLGSKRLVPCVKVKKSLSPLWSSLSSSSSSSLSGSSLPSPSVLSPSPAGGSVVSPPAGGVSGVEPSLPDARAAGDRDRTMARTSRRDMSLFFIRIFMEKLLLPDFNEWRNGSGRMPAPVRWGAVSRGAL